MNETFFLKSVSFEVDLNTNLVTNIKWHFNYENDYSVSVDIYGLLDQINPSIDGTNLTLEELDILLPEYIDIEQLKQYSLSDMSGVF